ncbi:MAG TPA: T9SS type A sorting domain-containing protein, partial [Flavobacteriales bacterium]|nr:T9SS type A sorting domain-containing protein [Flavobacteriales bacterium]
MEKTLLIAASALLHFALHAQTGPNSPASASNNAAIGANAWSSPTNIYTSNNARASVATKGLSNYLEATNFGFAIPTSYTINGITVEAEKSTLSPSSVALLNTWSTGLTKSISAGTDRYLIVVAAMENGSALPNITGMTYGGQTMTELAEMSTGTSFYGKIEVWVLTESGIAAASSTSIVPTYSSFTATEYCEVFSSATFQFVDQLVPVSSIQSSNSTLSTNPHLLGTAITTLDGSAAINAVMCGNNTEPAVAIGGTNTYTINSSYVEGNDIYFANTGFSSTGGCLQTSHKLITTGGTEQPSCTFNGTVNRHAMIGFTLQRAREIDNEVKIIKGGSITGSNMAATPAWSTTEAYTTYGGSTSLWGTTWTANDINAVNFGVALAVRVQNGTARVDHTRITVYATNSLPIELIDFSVENKLNYVDVKWATATEINNDFFLVQRSIDGITFKDIEQVDAAGNSSSLLFYGIQDENPCNGVSYYRLKQVDFNGNYSYSDTKAVTFVREEDFNVFPNPTSDGILNIYSANPETNEVWIYSGDLKLIKKIQLPEANPILSIEELIDGFYFLLFKAND